MKRIRELDLFDDNFYFNQLVAQHASVFPIEETMLEHYLTKGHAIGLLGHPDSAKSDRLKQLLSSQVRKVQLVSSLTEPAPAIQSASSVKPIAFYLPQYHPIPENDKWWGAGFTEWNNVTRARPFFAGHNQPRVPADLGYYDLRVSEVREKQAELARNYGIFGFCYYFYWFAGKRLLFRPLDEMLVSGSPHFPFCLCWANENWSRRWDGSENELLIAQDHTPENDIAFCESVTPYFQDPRYIRSDGRPLLLVYRPDALPDLAATLLRWRQHFRESGVGEVYLVAAMTFGFNSGIEAGFDAEVHFPPHSIHLQDRKAEVSPSADFAGAVFSYDEIDDRHMRFFVKDRTQFFTTMLEWDNTSRRKARGHVFTDFTLEKYEDWLRASVVKTSELYKESEQFVFINAWNEWGEGTYLEPDQKRGMAALEATRRAVQGLGGGSVDFIAESLVKYPPTHTEAALARLEQLRIACEGEDEIPPSIRRLFANTRFLRVEAVDHKPEPDCICWLESLRSDAVLPSSSYEISGWVLAREEKPAYIEIDVNDRILAEGPIETTRSDVYEYHSDYTSYRGPNAFLVVLGSQDILAQLRWSSSAVVRAKIYGRDGRRLAVIEVRFVLAVERSPMAQCIDHFQMADAPAAEGIISDFIAKAPILFVMHDLYPAGSQLFLINFLRWLKAQHSQVRFELLVLIKKSEMPAFGKGAAALQERLEKITETHWLTEIEALPSNLDRIEDGHYSLIYINSIASLQYRVSLGFLQTNSILHVHELKYVAESLIDGNVIDQVVKSEVQFIGCSRSVSESLVAWGAAADRVQTHYSFVPKVIYEDDATARDHLRAELDIPSDALVVLMVGSLNWRKGAHLLSCLARDAATLFTRDEMPYFVWVGDEGEADMRRRIEHEFALVGLQSSLRLTGHRQDVRAFYKAADLFALTSLEDPFPLVMLEACEERLPVVAFQNSGGADEFIAMGGGGVLAPMLDTTAMARAIYQILTDASMRANLSAKAEAFAQTLSFDRMAPKLLDFINARRAAFAASILS